MAHKLIDQTYRPYVNAPLCEFICDTDADIENLPQCCTGSKAVSVATGITFMVNASGNWVPLGGGIIGGSLEGDGQEFHQFAPTTLAFRSTEPLEEFQEVQVNGETVDPENYDLEEGSTIVKFKPDYLKTLGNGSHKVAIVSKNNVVSGKFEVKVPEVNEYGFYYNQPYTAFVEYFGATTVFFMRNDGTIDIIMLEDGYTETCRYETDGNNLTVFTQGGTFTSSVTADSIYCNELATEFVLGDTSIVADEDYIYIYKEELGGYEVKCIDKTKAEYGAIKTGINGINTVKLAREMFAENIYLSVAPEIPDSVMSIEYGAFRDCYNLTSITIPDSVTEIGDYAFEGCDGLTSITIPNSVTCIGRFVFAHCSGLTSVVIPDGVISIEPQAFYQCSGLTRVTIHGSVTYIGAGVFGRCENLNALYLTDVSKWCNVQFNSRMDNPLYLAKNLYLNGELVKELVIPDGVTSINTGTFANCDSLTSITIPDSVTEIGVSAFNNCSNLTSVTIPNSVTKIGMDALDSCFSLTRIVFNGTTAEWDAITKIGGLGIFIEGTHVQCTDGTVAL